MLGSSDWSGLRLPPIQSRNLHRSDMKNLTACKDLWQLSRTELLVVGVGWMVQLAVMVLARYIGGIELGIVSRLHRVRARKISRGRWPSCCLRPLVGRVEAFEDDAAEVFRNQHLVAFEGYSVNYVELVSHVPVWMKLVWQVGL